MKVIVKHRNSGIDKNRYDLYNTYIKFLYEELPLIDNLLVEFVGERVGNMTTGSRQPNYITVLSKDRMTRDILRTLSHEWVHEYQIGVLGREIGPDIGGQNEDEANSIAGQLIKIFEKKYPNYKESMFE
jgi:hypothetical protein